MEKVLCSKCRDLREYTISKIKSVRTIKGKEVEFVERIATCNSCKEYIFVPTLDDKNVNELEENYRKVLEKEKE